MKPDDVEHMTRSEKTEGVVWLEQLAARATAEAAVLRSSIEAEARQEWEKNRTAASWRIEDIALISAAISKGGFQISDDKTFTEWVAERYPTEVEMVQRVRGAFATVLLRRVKVKAGEVVDPEADDEVVPGMTYRKGGTFKHISITPDAATKANYAALAEFGLQRLALEAGPAVPVVLAEVEG